MRNETAVHTMEHGAVWVSYSPGLPEEQVATLQALLLVTAFFAVHRRYSGIEERHLERAFGEEYRRYQTQTFRFLGLSRNR